MSSDPKSSPLVQAILGKGEALPPLLMRTAVVRSLSKATTPWTVTIEMGGVAIPGVTFNGSGWDPQANDVCKVLQQGPELWVMGPLAPAKVVANTTVAAPAPPPPVAPPPPPPPTTRTVNIAATGSSTWQAKYGSWRSDVHQGGTSGDAKRGFWYYGTQIADAKGAGTIVGGSIFIKRKTGHGVGGKANVRLGTHGYTGQPANGGAAHAAVSVVGGLSPNEGATLALSQAIIDQLNAGARGLGLEPGGLGYTHPDYLIAYDRSAGDWSGALTLTIRS